MLKPQSSPGAPFHFPSAMQGRGLSGLKKQMKVSWKGVFCVVFFWWLDALKSFSLSKVSKARVHAAAWPRVKGDFGECEDGQY